MPHLTEQYVITLDNQQITVTKENIAELINKYGQDVVYSLLDELFYLKDQASQVFIAKDRLI